MSTPSFNSYISSRIHMNITPGDYKRKRKEYCSGTKTKNFKKFKRVHMPPLTDLIEVGKHVELDIKTESSFIIGNLKMIESRYNFILSVMFGLSGDFSYLLNVYEEFDLPLVSEMLMKMVSDYSIYETGVDGYKDIIVRRLALNYIFATTTKNEPTECGIHSKIVTRIVYGRDAIKCKESSGVKQLDIRGMFTFMARNCSRYGIRYLIDKNNTEEFFHFRIRC